MELRNPQVFDHQKSLFHVFFVSCGVLFRVPGCEKGFRGCSWGPLRIPFGKIGEPLGKIRGITAPGPLRILSGRDQTSRCFVSPCPLKQKN